ncbi:MAG: hypothetical protein ACXU9O_01510 [Gemmatimonadaceae bacterium]
MRIRRIPCDDTRSRLTSVKEDLRFFFIVLLIPAAAAFLLYWKYSRTI